MNVASQLFQVQQKNMQTASRNCNESTLAHLDLSTCEVHRSSSLKFRKRFHKGWAA